MKPDNVQFAASTATKPSTPLALSAEEIGVLLGVDVATVRNLHRFGKLKGGFRVGRALRWTYSDVVDFVNRESAQAKRG